MVLNTQIDPPAGAITAPARVVAAAGGKGAVVDAIRSMAIVVMANTIGPTAVVTLDLMWTPLRPFRAGPKRGTGCLSARCSGWIGMLGFFHVSNVILAPTGWTVFTASGTSAVATSRKTDFPVASTRGGSCPPTRALRTMLDFGQSGHEAAVLDAVCDAADVDVHVEVRTWRRLQATISSWRHWFESLGIGPKPTRPHQ